MPMTKPEPIQDKNSDFFIRGYARVPNIISKNHGLSFAEIGLYTVIKSYAWETGECIVGTDRMAEKFKVNRKTVMRLKQSLIDKGLIEEGTPQPTGRRPRKTYKMVDIWKKNYEFTEQEKKGRTNQ
jgi:predicted transcriptional regulator